MAKHAKRAVIYTRISKADRYDTAALTRQDVDGRELCDEEGWEVVGVFSDHSLSAYNNKVKRDGFDQGLAMITNGEADVLVAWAVDRVTRRVDVGLDLRNTAEEHGTLIATTKGERFDCSKAAGRKGFMEAVNDAEYESAKISERTRRSLAARAEAGRMAGGYARNRRPFGYVSVRTFMDYEGRSAETESMEVVEAEAIVYRDLVERALKGETLYSLTHWLRANVDQPTGTRAWKNTTVASMLRSPTYAGMRSSGGKLHKAVWPAIIDVDTHLALVAVLSRPAAVRRGKGLLSGMVKCATCKTTLVRMAARGRNGGFLYGCSHANGGCGRVHMMAAKAETEVVERLLDMVVEAFPSGEVVRHSTTKVEAGPTHEELDARAAMLLSMLSEGELNRDEYNTAKAKVEAERVNARRSVSRSKVIGRMNPLQPRKWWDAQTLDFQRTVLAMFVERVEIHPANGRNNVPANERVKLTPTKRVDLALAA